MAGSRFHAARSPSRALQCPPSNRACAIRISATLQNVEITVTGKASTAAPAAIASRESVPCSSAAAPPNTIAPATALRTAPSTATAIIDRSPRNRSQTWPRKYMLRSHRPWGTDPVGSAQLVRALWRLAHPHGVPALNALHSCPCTTEGPGLPGPSAMQQVVR